MSDRRPEKLYDPEAAALWWNAEGRHLSIVELHEAVTDPVAVVRRGVESGTIKGEVRKWCKNHDAEWDREYPDGIWCDWADTDQTCTAMDYLVIPVSDGGEDRP